MSYYVERLKQGLVIPDSHKEWKDYRSQVTKFILAHQNKDTLVILGAGPSNDIDLGKLSRCYKEIYLVDDRKEAIQEAVYTYQMEMNSNIKLLVSDFWEFPKMSLEGLEECLLQREEASFVVEYIEEMQRWAFENTIYPKIKKEADVCVLGLHSQFNSGIAKLLDYYKDHYTKEEMESFFFVLRKWNEVCIHRFHEYLFSNFSSFYFGYEYSSYENEDEYEKLRMVASLFQSGMAKQVSAEIVRVDGAYEAERELSKRIWEYEIEVVSVDYPFWNFTKEKGYLMCLYYLKSLLV